MLPKQACDFISINNIFFAVVRRKKSTLLTVACNPLLTQTLVTSLISLPSTWPSVHRVASFCFSHSPTHFRAFGLGVPLLGRLLPLIFTCCFFLSSTSQLWESFPDHLNSGSTPTSVTSFVFRFLAIDVISFISAYLVNWPFPHSPTAQGSWKAETLSFLFTTISPGPGTVLSTVNACRGNAWICADINIVSPVQLSWASPHIIQTVRCPHTALPQAPHFIIILYLVRFS